MRIRDRAHGRWGEILEHIGVDAYVLSGKHSACPGCGGKDRFRYLKDDDGGHFCGDERGDGMTLVQHVLGVGFEAAAKRVEEIVGKTDYTPPLPTYAMKLLKQAETVKDSLYLKSRGLETPDGLRWHRKVRHSDDGKDYAAMLAPVMRAGKFVTFHVTYLHRARKAQGITSRKILPCRAGGTIKGASVPLYAAEGRMGIAEGVETAIAAKMLHDVPVWAALSAGNLAAFTPPPGTTELLIFGDNDENLCGQAAAWKLAHRMKMKGIDIDVCIPKSVGDWNDEWVRAND